MTPPREPDEPDPLAAYADGDPDAVRAAAPREPGEAQWEAVRRKLHERLSPPRRATVWRGRAAFLAAAAALVAASVAVAWLASDPARRPIPPAAAPEVAKGKPVRSVPVAPAPSDPLAEFDVLPMATDDDVVLHRVPGDGWLPVGAHPLPEAVVLATAEEVELDDPDAAWPNVTPAPGYAPMIFAAKPR